MSLYRARRVAVSRFACLSLLLSLQPLLSAQNSVTGLVVDPQGRPLPRALVVLDAPDGPAAYTDEFGRFTLPISNLPTCRVTVRLSGFAPSSAPCEGAGGDRPLRIELSVAPVQETIIVTATRTDAPSGQVGASTTVFSEGDLERRQMPLVADLLRTTPGAMVVRSGAPGALTSLFVRGGESDYNKVLIDGIPLNEPGGAFYLNNLTTENLERIEVVRGAYSSLFGSDAMASVIQLFTRRANHAGARGSVQIDGGTYGTWHGSAAVQGTAGAWDYSLGAARLQSDNRVPNSALENTTLSANLGVALAPRATLRLIARGELEDAGTPGPTAFGRPDLDASFAKNDGLAGATFDQSVNAAYRQRVSYSIAHSSQASTNLVSDPPYVATYQGRSALFASSDFLTDSRTRYRRHHASYQGDWRVTTGGRAGDQRLTVLADWNGERATLEDRLAGTRTSHRRDNLGVSLQEQMLFRRLIVTVGARLERNENFGTAFVPRGSLVLVARDGADGRGETRVRVSAGTGVKEPTMLESFSVSPYFRGNPDLRPERSRSLEVGVEHRFARDRARVDLAWFDNRFRDIISVVSNPQTFEGQYFNVGVTDARGLEAGVEAALGPVRAFASYTRLDSEIVESTAPNNPLFAPGAWAFRRPRHSGSTGATAAFGRTTLDVIGVFVGRFVDSDFGLFDPPFVERPGHTTWDARAAVRLTRQVTALVSVDNLANADYSEPLGYQPLGRVVRAGLRVSFEGR